MAELVQVSKCTQFKANKAAIIRPRQNTSNLPVCSFIQRCKQYWHYTLRNRHKQRKLISKIHINSYQQQKTTCQDQ